MDATTVRLGSRGPEPFYPATCHPALSRRAFLAGAGALAAAGLLPERAARAGDDGVALIQTHATRLDDPWVLAHGTRAMGREFAVRGGRRAVDVLLERSLASLPANGKAALGFPLDVEVHQNSFLKTLLEAAVPLDHRFVHQGVRRTLQDVVDGAHLLFRPQWATAEPNRLPWSLIALTWTIPPLRRKWTNAWGEPVALDTVVETALGMLERAQAPVAEAMRAGRPLTAQAPVHGFTCGGTHMIYALLSAVHQGYGGGDRAKRVRQQVEILVWRLSADADLIDRFYAPRASVPGAAIYQLDAKLKVLGHAEECLALAEKRRLVTLTPAQQVERRAAVATVRRLIAELEASPRLLAEAERMDRALYQQLVGDTCHARHGFTLA